MDKLKKILDIIENIYLSLLIYIGGLVIHLFTIYVVYHSYGSFWGFLAFCSPVLSTIIMFILYFIFYGLFNSFCIVVLIYIALYIPTVILELLKTKIENKIKTKTDLENNIVSNSNNTNDNMSKWDKFLKENSINKGTGETIQDVKLQTKDVTIKNTNKCKICHRTCLPDELQNGFCLECLELYKNIYNK